MSLLRLLVKELGADRSRAWLADLITCHDEAVEDSRKHAIPEYPFFNAMALNDFTLICEFLGETARIHGIRCPEAALIAGTNTIAMNDLSSLCDFIETLLDQVLFTETVSLGYLRSNS